jgi:hypothetical protein
MNSDDLSRDKSPLAFRATAAVHSLLLSALQYRRLSKLVRSDEYAFLLNGHMGDVYNMCMLMDAFKRKNGGKICVVISKKFSFIARMFPAISRIIEVDKLLDQSIFEVTLSNVWFIRKGQLTTYMAWSPARAWKLADSDPRKYNFGLFFKQSIELGDDAKAVAPLPPTRLERKAAESRLKSNGLIMNKTVVLFPRAHAGIPSNPEFWSQLAVALERKGYKVVDRAIGKEKLIPSVKSIYVPEAEVRAFVECAGYSIGVRSGIQDLINCTKAQKIILYWKNIGFNNVGVMKMDSIKYSPFPYRNLTELEVDYDKAISEIPRIVKALVG